MSHAGAASRHLVGSGSASRHGLLIVECRCCMMRMVVLAAPSTSLRTRLCIDFQMVLSNIGVCETGAVIPLCHQLLLLQ